MDWEITGARGNQITVTSRESGSVSCIIFRDKIITKPGINLTDEAQALVRTLVEQRKYVTCTSGHCKYYKETREYNGVIIKDICVKDNCVKCVERKLIVLEMNQYGVPVNIGCAVGKTR